MSIKDFAFVVKINKGKKMKLTLVEKLIRVYEANEDVKSENFDMNVWKIHTLCGTSACLMGNAMLNDDYFEKNNLLFNENNIIFSYPLNNQTYYNISAIAHFFGISEKFAEIMFLPVSSKVEILNLLKLVISFLEKNLHGKMWELLIYLQNNVKDQYILEYFVEFNETELEEWLDDELDDEHLLDYYEEMIQMFKSRETLNHKNYLYCN